jgi:hypothetical protein
MVFPLFNYRVFMVRIQYAMHVSLADKALVAVLMMRKTNGRQLELHLRANPQTQAMVFVVEVPISLRDY